MKQETERASFATKLGIVLATAGSAVGLGNVWRFPYMAGENGGAVFILIYIGCVLLLGIPCLISEFIIGRHARSNTARAYSRMSAGRGWAFVGAMSVLTGFLITGYYAVVAGWTLQYLFGSLVGHVQGSPEHINNYFAAFTAHPLKPVLWLLVVMALTYLIVERGVRNGIERASKVFMPALFLLLLVIVVASCLLPGAEAGIAFMFKPDFSAVSSDVFLSALGQAFYSLSIAMGCICTYASYFARQTKLTSTAVQIGIIDSIVAVLAGLMIFPAAFSVGVRPDSGPSLVFITLPNVFQQAFSAIPLVGYAISILFFALLALAALTSLISLYEVSTAFFEEELKITRKSATLLVAGSTSVIGIFCALSFGPLRDLQVAGMTLFEFFDFVTGQLFLPIVGFLTCIFIGWFVPFGVVHEEYSNLGTTRTSFFPVYIFLVKYICPVCILFIFLRQLNVI